MHSQGGYKKVCANMEAEVDQRKENEILRKKVRG